MHEMISIKNAPKYWIQHMQYHKPSLCPLNTLNGSQLTLHHDEVNF